MSAATAVPLSEYLKTTYRPDCDYLEGELLERNVGEWDHSRLQMLLASWLCNREEEFGITVVVEQRVQVKTGRFRVPDITVVRGAGPGTPVLVEPPFLCIEILSPSDRVTEMQERINDYLNFGVESVWLIDPATRQSFTYTRDGIREAKDGVLYTSNPDIRLVLSELK